MSFCRRRLTFALHPGRHIPREHHAWGKTMPSGVIRGAAPYFSNQELEQLVVITRRISGQTLTTWDFPILSFLSWAMSFLITRGAGAFSFFTRGAGACVQTLCHSVEADGIARFRDFASAGGRRGFTGIRQCHHFLKVLLPSGFAESRLSFFPNASQLCALERGLGLILGCILYSGNP